jgi:hypothetical protein
MTLRIFEASLLNRAFRDPGSFRSARGGCTSGVAPAVASHTRARSTNRGTPATTQYRFVTG